MQIEAKYNILMWGITLVGVLTFISLGLLALTQKQMFISWRFLSGWSEGAGAIIIGWLSLGAATAVLAFQLKISKFWLASKLIYVLFIIALAIYVLF